MIKVKNTTRADLEAAIEAKKEGWLEQAKTTRDNLPDSPTSDDFRPLWSQIKEVYIALQHSKCCFCEKPLEGKIEQDVEHFRPKAEVKPWKIPARLEEFAIPLRQPDDGASEPGYRLLAYEPLNYAMACKVCNSSLKRNYFPIAGPRKSNARDSARLGSEKAYLIYPLGGPDIDDDPETLIEFEGLSPRPATGASEFHRHRALITIEIFGLDDSRKRRFLFKARALLMRQLFLELERRKGARSDAARAKAQEAVDALVWDGAPFAACLRAFKTLYEDKPEKAEAYFDDCLAYLKTKSVG